MIYQQLVSSLGIQGVISNEELRARCPLHKDTNPSFSINLSKGTFICFAGCGSGDFIRLVELVLNCSPAEARDWVANNGRGTSLDQIIQEIESHNKPEEPADHNLGWVKQFENMTNHIMPMWFMERGFTWETVWKWNIRYDPLFDSVTVPVYWDKELVGTVTRHTKASKPKYENSPNLPRSNILFGEISTSKNHIILVEGVLDGLWLNQLGYNAVALLGTYLSGKQMDILRSYRFGEIILALDSDEAGQKGNTEAISRLTKTGWLLPQISIIRFPYGTKDPQECTPDIFQGLFLNRKEMVYDEFAGPKF